MKRLLSVILMISLILGNTVTVSAATTSSVSGNELSEEYVMEDEEAGDDVTVEEESAEDESIAEEETEENEEAVEEETTDNDDIAEEETDAETEENLSDDKLENMSDEELEKSEEHVSTVSENEITEEEEASIREIPIVNYNMETPSTEIVRPSASLTLEGLGEPVVPEDGTGYWDGPILVFGDDCWESITGSRTDRESTYASYWRLLDADTDKALIMADGIFQNGSVIYGGTVWEQTELYIYLNSSFKTGKLFSEGAANVINGDIRIPTLDEITNPAYGYLNSSDASKTRIYGTQYAVLAESGEEGPYFAETDGSIIIPDEEYSVTSQGFIPTMELDTSKVCLAIEENIARDNFSVTGEPRSNVYQLFLQKESEFAATLPTEGNQNETIAFTVEMSGGSEYNELYAVLSGRNNGKIAAVGRVDGGGGTGEKSFYLSSDIPAGNYTLTVFEVSYDTELGSWVSAYTGTPVSTDFEVKGPSIGEFEVSGQQYGSIDLHWTLENTPDVGYLSYTRVNIYRSESEDGEYQILEQEYTCNNNYKSHSYTDEKDVFTENGSNKTFYYKICIVSNGIESEICKYATNAGLNYGPANREYAPQVYLYSDETEIGRYFTVQTAVENLLEHNSQEGNETARYCIKLMGDADFGDGTLILPETVAYCELDLNGYKLTVRDSARMALDKVHDGTVSMTIGGSLYVYVPENLAEESVYENLKITYEQANGGFFVKNQKHSEESVVTDEEEGGIEENIQPQIFFRNVQVSDNWGAELAGLVHMDEKSSLETVRLTLDNENYEKQASLLGTIKADDIERISGYFDIGNLEELKDGIGADFRTCSVLNVYGKVVLKELCLREWEQSEEPKVTINLMEVTDADNSVKTGSVTFSDRISVSLTNIENTCHIVLNKQNVTIDSNGNRSEPENIKFSSGETVAVVNKDESYIPTDLFVLMNPEEDEQIIRKDNKLIAARITVRVSHTNSVTGEIIEKEFIFLEDAIAYLNTLADISTECTVEIAEDVEMTTALAFPKKVTEITFKGMGKVNGESGAERIKISYTGDLKLLTDTSFENIELIAKKYNSKTQKYEDYQSAVNVNGKVLSMNNATADVASITGSNTKAVLNLMNSDITVKKAVASIGYLNMEDANLTVAQSVAVTDTLTMKSSIIDAGTQVTVKNVVTNDANNVIAYGGNSKTNILNVTGNISSVDETNIAVRIERTEISESGEEIDISDTATVRKNAIQIKPKALEPDQYKQGVLLCNAAKAGATWFVVGTAWENNEQETKRIISYGTYKKGNAVYCGKIAENVKLYSCDEREGNYVWESSFETLQEAFSEIDKLALSDQYYYIQIVKDTKDVVTFIGKNLTFPSKAAEVIIDGGFIYMKDNLTLKCNTAFENTVLVPNKEAVLSMGKYKLLLEDCFIGEEENGIGFKKISASGVTGTSKLILDNTSLTVNGEVSGIGTLVYADTREGVSQYGLRRGVPVYPTLTVNGKSAVGNIELQTEGYLTGLAKVTRNKTRNVTAITPQITISGEVTSSSAEHTLYLDLQEAVSKKYEQLKFSDSNDPNMENIRKLGVKLAKADKVTYPNIKAAQCGDCMLVKSGGYLTWFESGNGECGVELSYKNTEDKTVSISCRTFADAVTEINSQKIKRDYTITVLEANTDISGANQSGSREVPKVLTMPNKNYVATLTIQADADTENPVEVGFINNITLTSNVVLKDIAFVQMLKSGSGYVRADVLKDDYPAAVTLNVADYDLTLKGSNTFNTPLVLKGGAKGTIRLGREGTITTLTNDYEPSLEADVAENVIYGMISGLGKVETDGCNLTLKEYRSSRTSTKYTASSNKITTLNVTEDGSGTGIVTVVGKNTKTGLNVTNLNNHNGKILSDGKVELKNVLIEGEQEPTIGADLDFKITGTFTNNSNNSILVTRLKGSGKAPYLNISGKVERVADAKPVTVKVLAENTAVDREAAITLISPGKTSAVLLTAKNAKARDFKPHAGNYTGGEYTSENTSGYMMFKSGSNICVYEGKNVAVCVYEGNTMNESALAGYFPTIKDATAFVNSLKKSQQEYTYVLMEQNGTVASPITISIPSYAKQVTLTSLEGCKDSQKTIYFSGNITLNTKLAAENVIFAPVKNKKGASFHISTGNYDLELKNAAVSDELPKMELGNISGKGKQTVILDTDELKVTGSISNTAKLIVKDNVSVNGSVKVSDLQMENAVRSNDNKEPVALSVKGAIAVGRLYNYGSKQNVLEFTRTAKNGTNLTINKLIENEDALILLKQSSDNVVAVLEKTGLQAALSDAKKFAVMPQASTDSFVIEAKVKTVLGNVDYNSAKDNTFRAVKANKGIYLTDATLAEDIVTLTRETDADSRITNCLDYAQAINEINTVSDAASDYEIRLRAYADSYEEVDTSVTDKNAYSPFPLPGSNKKKQLVIKNAVDDQKAKVVFTGNISGYGTVTLQDMELTPVKKGSDDAPVDISVKITADKTTQAPRLTLKNVSTEKTAADTASEKGFISGISGTKNKTDVVFENCENLILKSGITNVDEVTLTNTKLCTAGASSLNIIRFESSEAVKISSSWDSLGKLTVNDIYMPSGVTSSYIGTKLDKKGNPQFVLNKEVKQGTLLCKVYGTDTIITDADEIFETASNETFEKEAEKYCGIKLVSAKNVSDETIRKNNIRAYPFRDMDADGNIAGNAEGITKENLVSYKQAGYVINENIVRMAVGIAEHKDFEASSSVNTVYMEMVEEAKKDLQEYLKEKDIFAVVYMTDSYEVKENADRNSKNVVTVPSAKTVQILDVEVTWEYSDEWEEYLPIVWYKVQFYVGEKLYCGYIEESYLAYSDELLLQWKNDWNIFFSLSQLYAATDAYGDVKMFPTSYQSKLKELKDLHSNWTFVPMNVNRTWDACVSEQIGDYSWISSNQPAKYRGSKINSDWYYASRAGIEYYMDPRNFLTESNIFQFEQNTYNSSYHTEGALQSFLNNTFMKGKVPKDSKGRTYAQVIFQSGQSRGLSPFNLAARVIQEQGVNGTSAMISGTYPGYVGYYNHYNIGASGNTDAQVLKNGLTYAKNKGWNTITKSLEGGAEFIGNGYILQGQDTLYLQKFDIEHGDSYIHQYMQNIMAPYTEGRSMKSMYVNAGSLNSAFVFKIPVFQKMPNEFSLNASSKTLYRGVEGENTFTLKVKCSGTWVESKDITFTSENEKIAKVSSEGVITAVGSGTVTINAKVKLEDMDEVVELQCKITVMSPLQDITVNVNQQELYMAEGLPDRVPYLKEDGTTGYKEKSKGELPAQVTLEVSYVPVDTTDNRTVTWTVADPNIVSLESIELKPEDVTAKAVVAAKAGGTTTVTAKVGKITKAVEITVRVPMLEAGLKQSELITENNKLTLHKGESVQVPVGYAPYHTTDPVDPVWSVNKNADASVIEIKDGMITAKKAGSTTLHAAIGPFDGSQKELTLQVVVEEYKVTFMNPDGTSAMLTMVGEYGKSLEYLVSDDMEAPWQMKKEGSFFAGWYTGKNGTGNRVTEKTVLYDDMKLYPHFMEISKEQKQFYVAPIGSVTYTGTYLKPEVKVYGAKEVNGELQLVELKKGTDYTVSYANNKQVNDGSEPEKLPTAVIDGKGQYADVPTVETVFSIVPKSISHVDVIAENLFADYTGKLQKLRPAITDAGRTLQRNLDYTLEYTDVAEGSYLEAGTYTVKVIGIGNYTGTRYVYITITKRIMMEEVAVSVASSVKFNNGNPYTSVEDITECKPVVTVKYKDEMLVENRDYELTYNNNTQIGKANIRITGLGSYNGTRLVSFEITGTDISEAVISGISDAEYTGEPIGQTNIRVQNKADIVLREGLDYEVNLRNNVETGRARVEIIGKNGYTGSVTKTFTIAPYDIAENDLWYQNPEDGEGENRRAFFYEFTSPDVDETDLEHTIEYVKGGAKPSVTVTFKGEILTEGVDYKVSYENYDKVGETDPEKQPSVIITGKGRFIGSVTENFAIVKKDISRIDEIEVKDVAFKNRKGFCFVEPILTEVNGKRLEAGEDYELKYTYVYDTVLNNEENSSKVIRTAGSEVEPEDIPKELADSTLNGGRPCIKVTAYGIGNYEESSEISATYKILESSSWLDKIM